MPLLNDEVYKNLFDISQGKLDILERTIRPSTDVVKDSATPATVEKKPNEYENR